MRLRLSTVRVPLRSAFVSATSEVRTRELLLVELEASDGVTGCGEAAPLESYDGVSLAATRAALEDCRPVLADASTDGADHAGLLEACRRVAVLPQAVAAIDLALWDMSGRRSGRPVWQLLGADVPGPVPVNATIAAADRGSAAAEAGRAAANGFRCLKVKVGLGDDAGRLAAVRAVAGPEMALRIDANGVWSVAEALASLRVLEPCGIELCEEPASGLEANRAVAMETRVPVALDESSILPGALDDRACTAVCLKISRCGGISGLLDAARRARAAGYEIYLASTLDGPLGIAAALHAAALLGPDRPCGLSTLDRFGPGNPLPATGGAMRVPDGPGLGGGLLAWYRAS